MEEEAGLFSGLGATQGLESQAFDFGAITESQLQSQVDFSFLDFAHTQGGAFDDYALQQPSQVGQGCARASLRHRWGRHAAIAGSRSAAARRRSPLPPACRLCRSPPFSPRRAMRRWAWTPPSASSASRTM